MNNIFTRLLEIIWLIVGVLTAFAAFKSYSGGDKNNGIIMALCSLIGFLMFYARRTIRLKRKNQNQ